MSSALNHIQGLACSSQGLGTVVLIVSGHATVILILVLSTIRATRAVILSLHFSCFGLGASVDSDILGSLGLCNTQAVIL